MWGAPDTGGARRPGRGPQSGINLFFEVRTMSHPLHSVIRTWTRLALHVIGAITAIAAAGTIAVTVIRSMVQYPGAWTGALIVAGAAVAAIAAACSGERGAR